MGQYQRAADVTSVWPGASWYRLLEVGAGALVLKRVLFPSDCMGCLNSTKSKISADKPLTHWESRETFDVIFS